MRIDRLREIRESRGLSQEELAARIKIHPQQIYKIEKGISPNPSSDTITAMARELEVSTDYLLGLVDAPNDTLKEAGLSPMERKLLQAVRSGLITESLETLATLSKSFNQSDIASE